jgi:hypothetical protein
VDRHQFWIMWFTILILCLITIWIQLTVLQEAKDGLY